MNLSPENRIGTERQMNALPNGLPFDVLELVKGKASQPTRTQPSRQARPTKLSLPTSQCRPNLHIPRNLNSDGGGSGGFGLAA
jgi:hypothetical protein